ncbi:MAG: hypothetical protein EOO17_00015 [Chloroflexi bacterium]|nr:MAG: hypothetical protein EOO17_00015 [Chloroflexota bacterium]
MSTDRNAIALIVFNEAMRIEQHRKARGVEPTDSDYAIAIPGKILASLGLSTKPELATVESHFEVADIVNGMNSKEHKIQGTVYYDFKEEKFIGTSV